MIAATHAISPSELQSRFLSLLPRIEAHARVHFRHVRCRDRKEDFGREAVALCWLWFVRLTRRGKDPAHFASALARFAARQVRAGRRLAGMDRARDVLSPRAQCGRGFTVSPLPQGSSLDGNILDEALHDNARTPVPDQVSFRLDFPRWRKSLSLRDRRIVGELMRGERTLDVAARHGLSPGRISQLRREFRASWLGFGEEPAAV